MVVRSIEATYGHETGADGNERFIFAGGHTTPIRDRNHNLERWALINEVVKAERIIGWPMSGTWRAVLDGDIEEARKAVERMRKDYELP